MKKRLLACLLALGITVSGTGMEHVLPVSAAEQKESLQDAAMVEMEGMDISEPGEEGLPGGSILLSLIHI